ncbi:MAG: ribonuclease HII [Desulfovibrio sp.]|jgi:ribonuclease HII|nr:ribonuclease HII [Desulfovibrio sp.]
MDASPIGVDEAGRGCLAGPVMAGAVLFPPGFDHASRLPGLDDSKKLSPARREALARIIREQALAFGLGLAWQEEVDALNIQNATFRAMSRAVLALAASLPFLPPLVPLWIDGPRVIPCAHWKNCLPVPAPGHPACALQAAALRLPPLLPPSPAPPPQQAFVDGDARLPVIAAASILAKTARDALMTRLDSFFPGYGFARHKGYGTRAHQDALARQGPCPLHRRTFRRVRPEQIPLLREEDG